MIPGNRAIRLPFQKSCILRTPRIRMKIQIDTFCNEKTKIKVIRQDVMDNKSHTKDKIRVSRRLKTVVYS